MHNHAAIVTMLSCIVSLTAPAPAGSPPGTGVQYGEFWQNSLEIFMPNTCEPPPLVVYIHGGGWLAGDASDVAPYVASLVDRGFAVASLNYTWSHNGTFPAQIHDCKGAIRWLRANADDYFLNAESIAVFGDSSGAHLAALLATSASVAELEGVVGGNLEQSSAIQYAGCFYGIYDLFTMAEGFTLDGELSQLFGANIDEIAANYENPKYADLVALVESANPINHLTPDDPPFNIAHGNDDTFVPPVQSQLLHAGLQNEGLSSTLQLVPGFAHKLPDWVYQITFDYFEAELKPNPPMAGDTNCDLQVNVDDLLNVINNWGVCPDPPQGPCMADFDYNGNRDVDDLLRVTNNWSA